MLKNKEQDKVIHAVLTGDIVNSTRMEPALEEELLNELKRILFPYEFEFYRGDSFQAYMREPHQSLRVALSCRAVTVSRTTDGEEPVPFDVKISIGLGKVIVPVTTLGTAKGEAFLLSGRALDEMNDTGRRLSIVTDNPLANIGLQVMSDYLDAIFRDMTAKQAEVIAGLLYGGTQQEIAASLDKSKSTVSQLVNSGGWPAIERLLQQYENFIKLLV